MGADRIGTRDGGVDDPDARIHGHQRAHRGEDDLSEAPTKPTVSVAGPDGKTYSTGSTQATDAVVGIGLSSAILPSGVYTMTWSLTAPDGDAQNGTWTYPY
ncbi:copper resistance protein CopC [Mycobacteroides franklinii]|uniref:copper resistance protein CopC n=1 Tax=Mycobacteroides franklinii TaxID=948102 RepID=UPI0012FF5E1A|nr:copper resistance protein CopC [Mycobacteroides franklinii]